MLLLKLGLSIDLVESVDPLVVDANRALQQVTVFQESAFPATVFPASAVPVRFQCNTR